MRLRSNLPLILTASLAVLAGCAKHPQPPPPGPAQVGVVTLQSQSVELTTELPGRTVAYEVSDVRPQVSGVIKARLFKEGTDVKAGQVLYQIDPAPYQAAFDQSKALLANAQANLTTTRLKADRYGDLVKINAVSKQDYDDARAQYQQAAATVAQDQASLESARINLGYTRVTAPISGRIGRSTSTPGALATAGQTNAFATIQALNPIYVDLTQPSDEILRLKSQMAKGQLAGAGADQARVKLILSDGSTYPVEGQFRFSEAAVDQSTGSVTLRAIFANPRAVLLPGMFVRAVLSQGTYSNGVLAPQQGVSHDPKGQASAMVVGPDGKAQARTLKTAGIYGDKWLVTEGLKPGDRLIVQGLLKVQPGAPVKATEVSPASLAPGSNSPPATGG